MCCCCCSVAKSCPILYDPMDFSMPGYPVHYLLEFFQIYVHWVSDAKDLMLCHPFSSCPQSFPASGSFPMSNFLYIRWPKYWSFSFSISPSNEYSGFISFRIDWIYLLSVQGTFKSILQHHSLKTSVLRHSAFFMVQLSHLYITIALTIWTFVSEVMSLLFNTLPAFVIAILTGFIIT